MEVIQSFVYTIQRASLSIYEQRILLMIVKHAQSRISGHMIKNELNKWQHDFNNVHLMVPIRELLDEGNKHYELIYPAAERLCGKVVKFQDPETGSWFASSVIYNVNHNPGSGVIDFYVARKVFDALLDFSKGFRQYHLETALSIPSPYASRFYSLMSGQVSPLRLEVEELKKMFGVENKYKQTADFIKKVVEPSKRLLDDKKITSFTYSRIKVGCKVVALLFFPVRREEPTREHLLPMVSVSQLMTPEIKQHLLQIGQFTTRELSGHKPMLDDFCKLPTPLAVLDEILNRAIVKNKGKGYIISAMRSEVAEFKKQQSGPGSSEDLDKSR